MIKIIEATIFDLIDGNLSDGKKSEVLRDLPKYPELEKLYRTLLMTEGYIRANNLEKASPEFTDKVTRRLQFLLNQKKRNGILYRALSIVGLVTVLSIGSIFFMMGSTPSEGGGALNLNYILQFANQVGSSLSFLSGEAIRNILIIVLTFTFFVFVDRMLLRHFHLK